MGRGNEVGGSDPLVAWAESRKSPGDIPGTPGRHPASGTHACIENTFQHYLSRLYARKFIVVDTIFPISTLSPLKILVIQRFCLSPRGFRKLREACRKICNRFSSKSWSWWPTLWLVRGVRGVYVDIFLDICLEIDIRGHSGRTTTAGERDPADQLHLCPGISHIIPCVQAVQCACT